MALPVIGMRSLTLLPFCGSVESRDGYRSKGETRSTRICETSRITIRSPVHFGFETRRTMGDFTMAAGNTVRSSMLASKASRQPPSSN